MVRRRSASLKQHGNAAWSGCELYAVNFAKILSSELREATCLPPPPSQNVRMFGLNFIVRQCQLWYLFVSTSIPGSDPSYSDTVDDTACFAHDHSTYISLAGSREQLAVPQAEKMIQEIGTSTETSVPSDQGMPSTILLCEFCDKSFASGSGLFRHKNRVHSLKRLPHVCTICGKGFNEKENYEGHMNMHNNIRAYKCPNCSGGWFYKNSLREHIRFGGCKKQVDSWP